MVPFILYCYGASLYVSVTLDLVHGLVFLFLVGYRALFLWFNFLPLEDAF